MLQAQRKPYTDGAIIQTVKVLPGQIVSATVTASDIPYGTATSCVLYPAILVTPPGLTDLERSVSLDQMLPFRAVGLPTCIPWIPGQ
jgi:hypothetical protein